MELYTLKINVNKQRLSFGENKPEIFSGDQSIDFVEFTLDTNADRYEQCLVRRWSNRS